MRYGSGSVGTMARYVVSEAVLVRAEANSAWRLTFSPMDGDGEEIRLVVASDVVEEMSFADAYTSVEIEALKAR
jgi:hypothetical protein